MNLFNSISENTYHDFNQQGFLIRDSSDYGLANSSTSTYALKKEFDNLAYDTSSPGSRYRAYLKLLWSKETNKTILAEDQRYYQTYLANSVDGGKIREFQVLRPEIFHNESMQKIIKTNLEFIQNYPEFYSAENLIFGIHFIRYQVEKGKAAYSSPMWLHVDDEPLVFIHLVNITDNIIGGDNLIAGHKAELQGVIRLSKFMDTLALNRNVRHAVTPMGSTDGVATRDIILFTVEPYETNQGRHR